MLVMMSFAVSSHYWLASSKSASVIFSDVSSGLSEAMISTCAGDELVSRGVNGVDRREGVR